MVQILADWSDERYPLYAYYASRHLPPAKIRAFLDFVGEIADEDGGSRATPKSNGFRRSSGAIKRR